MSALVALMASVPLACDDEGGTQTDDMGMDVLDAVDGDAGQVDTGVDTGQEDTGQVDTGQPGSLCDPCEQGSDCGSDGDLCLTVDGNQFCGRDCADDPMSCPTGYQCSAVGEAMQCVPASGSCDGRCGGVFCAADEVCDTDTMTCIRQLELCDIDCQDDARCGGPDDVCVSVQEANESFCARDCSADPMSCPEGYFCAELDNGARQCVPELLTCVDRCSETTCPDGQVCDPFTGDCRLPLGLCDGPCVNSGLCGTDEGDVCVGINDEETVCAFDCTEDPTVCPTGYFCAELEGDMGSKCIPSALTCRADRCNDVSCGSGSQCDPATGACVTRLELCEGPCDNNNACLGPNDVCLSFESGESFCTQNCDDTGRCPLGYGCFLLNAGGRFCIPTNQTCAFDGAECTYDTRFSDCPGDDVFCSAVRPGDTGRCTPRCDADAGGACPAGQPLCTELHIYPDLCLASSPVDAASCGRIAEAAQPIGRPCGGELDAFCPAPTTICYDATDDDTTAPFCTVTCTTDADCGVGASCEAVSDRADPICIPDACSTCLAEPAAGSVAALAAPILTEAGLTACTLALTDEVLAVAEPTAVNARPVVPAFETIWRQPLGAADRADTLATALDAAAAGSFTARDALLSSAAAAGWPVDTPDSGNLYTPDATQPLASAVAELITRQGGTPDVSALESDAADVPMALQSALAPVILAIADAAESRADAFPVALTDPAIQSLFDGGHAAHLRLPSTVTPPDFTDTTVVDVVSQFDAAPLLGGAARIVGEIEAQSTTLQTDGAWGAFDFGADTPIGRIVISGNEDSVHEPTSPGLGGDIALFVDAGGDDTYRVPVGANTSVDNGVAVHLDLGGADTYTYVEVSDPNDTNLLTSDADGRYEPSLGLNQEDGPVSLSNTARQGAGRFGIGIAWDAGTEIDAYESLRLSQGFALYGVGILVDGGGNDTYSMEAAGQGAAIQGVGLLLDVSGDDAYTGWSMIQGSGGSGGLGTAIDVDGSDTWTAVPGQANGVEVLYFNLLDRARSNLSLAQGAGAGRGGTLDPDRTMPLGGGLGILRDAAGSDTYLVGVIGQGAGADRGAGWLLDGGSAVDTYDGRRVMQGAAIRLAAGLLVDEGGDDLYNTTLDRIGTGHGVADDLATSVLVDAGGADQHNLFAAAGGVGTQNGIALLIDATGDDTWETTSEQSLGFANADPGGNATPERLAQPTIGLFLDDGTGTDTYSGTPPPGAGDDQTWTGVADDTGMSSETGVGMDE